MTMPVPRTSGAAMRANAYQLHRDRKYLSLSNAGSSYNAQDNCSDRFA
jgi:hypothetical protein